jgi:hypothetical protein
MRSSPASCANVTLVMPDRCSVRPMARSRLAARVPPSDPRCRGASQRSLRQIMQSPGAPKQARGALPRAQAMSG